MKWLELKLDTSPAGLEAATQLLEEQGITGLVIDDEGDFRDFLEHNHQYWDYVDEELMQEKQGLCRITFYLSDDPEGYHRLAQVRMALSQLKAAHPEYAPLLLTMNELEDADWENNWKQFYKPMEIGERLIVVPEWEQANTQGRIPLILNPGLTFGTGSHATTRLCLTALEETIHGGERVLDLGCGYGWHCKYAAENGAKQILGIDLSENMIREAKKKNNDPKIKYEVCGLDNFSYPKNTFDCVVSNLVLHYINDLDEIYKKVYRTLKPGGTFIFNIEHPIFTGSVNQEWIYGSDGSIQYWPIDNYFYTGERQTNFLGKEVVKQHHTLTQILMGLIKTGFQLEAVQEAVPPPEMMDIPGMSDELRRPMMLLVKCKK